MARDIAKSDNDSGLIQFKDVEIPQRNLLSPLYTSREFKPIDTANVNKNFMITSTGADSPVPGSPLRVSEKGKNKDLGRLGNFAKNKKKFLGRKRFSLGTQRDRKFGRFAALKKAILNKDLASTRGKSRAKDTLRTKRFSLPPTPKLQDDDIKELCRKLKSRETMEKIQKKNGIRLGKNKVEVTNIIKQCFEYELEDEIPFKVKYNYRMFLERYYQEKFEEMVEISKSEGDL